METNQYLDLFIDESSEHLQSINDRLLELEKSPEDTSIVGEIFRSAHTLKGMAATMGYEDLADLTHKMENVLDGVRNDKIQIDAEMLDIVFESVDHLEAMVLEISQGGTGERDIRRVVELLQAIELGDALDQRKKEQSLPADTTPFQENSVDEFTRTVLKQSKEQGLSNYHIIVSLREDCMLKAARVYMVFDVLEQMGEVILSTPPVEDLENEDFETDFQVLFVTEESREDIDAKIMKVSEVHSVHITEYKISETENKAQVPSAQIEKDDSSNENNGASSNSKQALNKTIRVNIDRLDVLMNLFEELVIDRGRLEQISNELQHSELQETVERMSRVSGDLQNIILNMRMVPIEQVFNRFPRMVRQLSRDLNKDIDLRIIGEETELDRTVIDEIGDPLVHLLRNAIDHGIESPNERKKNGKSGTGSIELKAYHSGNYVFIDITDDGGGINREKVLKKALDNQVVTSEQAEKLSEQEVYELIMASGFSTADTISDVSGRGVGLDVVKNTIESLGGTITINSQLGEGSNFSIQLPLTLSIISVMLVEVQKEKYAIPLSSIIETAIVKKEEILRAHNKEVIDFRGSVVPLVFLKDVLEVPIELEEDEYYSLVIVRKGNKMAGLVVDSFIGQQEVVLKSLGDYLSGVFAISGATILGDGQVALILDANALIK
ncbi:chemotaxis protein CheA [Halobacillus sp. Marseille-P3879]|uniref:chemotaxis protein CheA n=1 Tax=Halobacillus sp. Marseille-P3879 TaxID=2045014 RepID=UPI000C7D10CA|nr:chemotaxis protein CheA [Halobacillus sp. Marseille-P3879]